MTKSTPRKVKKNSNRGRVEPPDLESKASEGVKVQLAESFGDADVMLKADRVERSFSEFIARVPGGLLGGVGLKRH